MECDAEHQAMDLKYLASPDEIAEYDVEVVELMHGRFSTDAENGNHHYTYERSKEHKKVVKHGENKGRRTP